MLLKKVGSLYIEDKRLKHLAFQEKREHFSQVFKTASKR